jgi:hypothetical protein
VSLQRRSCPHWDVLSQNHRTRLHHDSPSEDEILRVSNFLTGGNQTELWRPQRIRALIWLEAEERAARPCPTAASGVSLQLPRHRR